MADFYGPSADHWHSWLTIEVVDEGDTYATLRFRGGPQAESWGFNITSGITTTLRWTNDGGAHSGSGGLYSATGQSGWSTLADYTDTFQKYHDARTIDASAETVNASGWRNGTSTASGSIQIGALEHQLVTVPGTPTVTATRSSDTSIDVTWSLKQPTNGSITSNRIEVKIDEESWTTISSSLSGSATSYTYSSSSANHRYQFRVASSSSAGQSDYGESEYVYTTPAAPTGGYGVIRGTNVGVTALIDNIKYPSGYEWQRSANGSTEWTNINGAQSSISDTYSGSTAPYYRVRCVGVGGLASAYCPAFQVSKGYNIYVNSAGSTPDKINFYVPSGSSIKSIKILV